jgi:hypothetical protein
MYDADKGEGTTVREWVHNGGLLVSVHRTSPRAPRGRLDGHERTHTRARRRRRQVPVLFHLPIFEISQLKIFEHNLKIPKYESCRETI